MSLDNKRDQLEELLVDWGLQRQQGNELSAEELCQDNPELAPDLSKMILQLKEMDWLEEDDDVDDDFLNLPDFSTVSGHADESRLPECKLSLDEFCQRLVNSGLMDEEQVEQAQQRISADDGGAFAQQLVGEKRLTRFQATVLLEGRDIPLVLDRYVLLGEIGKGGMGTVYKALHQQMDRVVALKILSKEAVDSEDKVKRFHREVKAAAKLTHQNIVVAYDAREDKGYHFLVMELVAGSDLADLVRKQGPVSCAKAVDYIAQAARGLEHAHGMGIIHRDIKPGNLLLNKKGKVKILDMGLARIEGGDPEHDKTVSQELTQAGMVMGTIAYLAPEQALDTRHADARSDIYSLGCTLFYLLTGRTIYNEDTIMKTIIAHREGVIPSLCAERDGVPAELDAIFQKMVAKQPEDRFQSMAEVITALEESDIEDEEGTQPAVAGSQALHETATFIDTSREVVPPLTEEDFNRPAKRRRGMIVAGLLGVMALAAGIVIKLQTPGGYLVLEIDQPEILGAQVLIDGDEVVTIKTGNGKQDIRVRLDGQRHKLEVQMAGFETFTEEFTYDTGNSKTISVRLEPLGLEVVGKQTEAQPVVASKSGQNWALQFDGERDYVEVPTLQLDGLRPLTVEARVTAFSMPTSGNQCFVIEAGGLLGLKLIAGERWAGSGKTESELAERAKHPRLEARSQPSSASVNTPVHIALVYDMQTIRLFVNGIVAQKAELVDITNAKRTKQTTAVRLEHESASRTLIGCFARSTHSPKYPFHGVIDDVRISNVARYTEDYTPTARLEADEHTLAFYHFDEGTGDVLKDSSGNGHHGTIHGAKWVEVDHELKVIGEAQMAQPATPYNWPKDQPAPAIAPFTAKEAKQHQEE